MVVMEDLLSYLKLFANLWQVNGGFHLVLHNFSQILTWLVCLQPSRLQQIHYSSPHLERITDGALIMDDR